MSSNGKTNAEKTGYFNSDWVESINSGTEAVNLAGWGLSDDADPASSWTFPAVNNRTGPVSLYGPAVKTVNHKGESRHGLLRGTLYG